MTDLSLKQKIGVLVRPDTPIDDIEEAARYLWDEFKERRGHEDRQAAFHFNRGQKVEFIGKTSRRLPKGAIGIIEKINAKTVSVNFGFWQTWNVAASMLNHAPKDAKVTGQDRKKP